MTVRYSHPPERGSEGVHLRDHLAGVADRAEYLVDDDETTPDEEPLSELAETVATLHDFGKATTFFQNYIDESAPDPEKPAYRHHALIGAFASYYALGARGFGTESCIAGFVAVAKHHGRLSDVAAYVHERADRRDSVSPENRTAGEERQDVVAKQIADIDSHASDLAANVFDDATNGAGSWSGFYDGFLDLLDEIANTVTSVEGGVGVDRRSLSRSCYALVLQCWSVLVFADKTDVVERTGDADAPPAAETYAAEQPSLDRLETYIDGLEAEADPDPQGDRGQRLDHYRSRARSAVLESTASFATEGGGIATLTLPTGMGKTLTGLSAAFDMRDRLDGERVVYALPFTSVIDQVVAEVEDVYDAGTTGRLLTAHHHLADTRIDDPDVDEADRDDDMAAMLGEGWRAGVTVTTFVQLFESLAGPRNRQSMKLPALRDSIIVLDEPQSLPLDWWKLAPRLVELLTERYGATVIAMTATQPRLFESAPGLDGATELVDSPDDYFDAVERVTYELDPSVDRYIDRGQDAEPKRYDDAAAALMQAVDEGESALAVCNTVDSARELTGRIDDEEFVDIAAVYAEILGESESGVGVTEEHESVDPATLADRVTTAGNRSLLHLSTRLRPVDRLTLIETAKELTERDHTPVTVSTQLVEAGVDISFDRVYRDLAPTDSIVQAAGRCNRSFERERGTVTVWWLAAPGEEAKTPAAAVYNRGTSLLPTAAATLADARDRPGDLEERDVAQDAVESYYRRLHEEKEVGKAEYVEYVDDVDAEALGELSLIDQRRAVDIVVCRTDADRRLVERIRKARDSYEFERLRTLLDETKAIRVSIPIYRHDSETAEAIRSLPPIIEDEGLYELTVGHQTTHFDEQLGFTIPDDTVEHRLL